MTPDAAATEPAQTQVTTRRLPDEESRDTRTVALRRYEVRVNGERVGIVGQHRVETVRGYGNSPIGYGTWRTAWFWESDDNAGDYEFSTRASVIAELVDFVGRHGT